MARVYHSVFWHSGRSDAKAGKPCKPPKSYCGISLKKQIAEYVAGYKSLTAR